LGISLFSNIDRAIYNEIYNDWKNPVMDVIMKGTERVTGFAPYAIANLGVIYFGKEKEVKAAKLSLTAWGISTVTTIGIRFAVNRPRPEDSINSRWNSSFPSWHTSSYFSMATVYAAKYPKLTIPLYTFGALVGLSRIYKGYHYPSDVLVGAILGWASGKLTLRLEKTLNRLFCF
jgi:membrane-associated phospholipid phosphatase